MAEQNHRMCISCRKTANRDQLWRVVRVFPNRQVQLDTGMGRSAYLCRSAECLKMAHKKDRLSRALRTKVPADIYQALENRLEKNTR